MPNNWLNKIHNHQVAPPADAWVNIVSKLDDEAKEIPVTVGTKMQAYEMAPPSGVLQNIFDQLDNETAPLTKNYTERIKEYSVAPPGIAWQNIASKLDAAEEKTIIGKKNKVIYLRIAAAAAVAAIISFFVINSTRQNNIAGEQAVTGSKQLLQPVIANGNDTAAQPAVANTKNSIEEKKKYTGKNTTIVDVDDPGYVGNNTVNDLAKDPATGNNKKLQNSIGESPMDIALVNAPNRYFSIIGADGQTVKVSSKFSNLAGYLTGKDPDTQENIEIIIEESAKWRKTFAAWRDKMTNNAVAPSLANFMDIIELSKILEDDK
ncbi:hypothetical protein [Ferruginibacter sp.]